LKSNALAAASAFIGVDAESLSAPVSNFEQNRALLPASMFSDHARSGQCLVELACLASSNFAFNRCGAFSPIEPSPEA
jgi:hypothetical protein